MISQETTWKEIEFLKSSRPLSINSKLKPNSEGLHFFFELFFIDIEHALWTTLVYNIPDPKCII